MEKPSQLESKQSDQVEQAKGYKWLLHSTGKFLFVTACLTISYLGFLLADEAVLLVIGSLLKDLIDKYNYIQIGFEGLRIFSALITGFVYLFHLLYAVYDQVHFIIRVFRQLREEES